MTESPRSSPTPPEKEPGWHPDRINPNLQRYWDGESWTATRRWVAGQWVDESTAPAAATSMPSGAMPTSQYVPVLTCTYTSTTQARPSTTVSAGLAGLLVSSVLLILGSFTPWVTFSLFGQSTSVAGTDSAISTLIGVNGWITFSAGILLFVLVCMIIISGEPFLRSVALVIALVAAGFAIYDLVRILQKISQAASADASRIGLTLKADNQIGWGLIIVAIGAVGALLCAFSERNG